DEIESVRSVKSFEQLPQPPDLAVIASPATSVPAIITEAGEKGTSTAIIVTAGMGYGPCSLPESCERLPRKSRPGLVGPECRGSQAPPAKLRGRLSAHTAHPGRSALSWHSS